MVRPKNLKWKEKKKMSNGPVNKQNLLYYLNYFSVKLNILVLFHG